MASVLKELDIPIDDIAKVYRERNTVEICSDSEDI